MCPLEWKRETKEDRRSDGRERAAADLKARVSFDTRRAKMSSSVSVRQTLWLTNVLAVGRFGGGVDGR